MEQGLGLLYQHKVWMDLWETLTAILYTSVYFDRALSFPLPLDAAAIDCCVDMQSWFACLLTSSRASHLMLRFVTRHSSLKSPAHASVATRSVIVVAMSCTDLYVRICPVLSCPVRSFAIRMYDRDFLFPFC